MKLIVNFIMYVLFSKIKTLARKDRVKIQVRAFLYFMQTFKTNGCIIYH